MSNAAAQILAKARLNREKLSEYPCAEPANVDEALAIQDAVMIALDDSIAGWKLGCTSPQAQAALKADGPIFGPVPSSRLFSSGADIPLGNASPTFVEAEIAVTLGDDLPPKPGGYRVEEVYGAVRSIHPSIELVSRRLPGGIADGVLWTTADGSLNDALILGAGTHDLPMEQLPSIQVEALLNGEPVSRGAGENALGGAHEALAWLANEFSMRGRTLHKGDLITTGLIADLIAIEPGDTFEARYSEIGSVKARFP
ncbi:MAG: 2-keto-4-pentenoate hydratase [Hyphomicrobiales bacterium]